MASFTPAFIRFFEDLSVNNTTEWFNQNRKTYEKEVKQPFSTFVEEMIGRIQTFEPGISIKAPEAIMRINKDIRFSKDKTPYNTHMAANISSYGRKNKAYPGFYFRLSHEGIYIVGGSYAPEPGQIQEIRKAILNDHKTFAAAYSDDQFKDKFGSLQGEKAKKLPQEFQDTLSMEPLIANKQFYYSASLKPEILLVDELPGVMMDFYKAGKRMNEFLKQAFIS